MKSSFESLTRLLHPNLFNIRFELAHLRPPPFTPEKQLTSLRLDMDLDLDSSKWDGIDCTPNTKDQMISLKRKVSQLLDQGSPNTTSLFLQWRLAVVESKLRVRTIQKQALSEENPSSEGAEQMNANFMALVHKDEKALSFEKAFLLSQRKILEEDLNDVVTSKFQLEEAYIAELRMSLEAASSSKQRFLGLKSPRLDRKHFQNIVNEYLDTKVVSATGDEKKWCHVLGYWLTPNSVKCAHIIPASWNVNGVAHMFGSDEPPLTSRKNGLSLQNKIAEAFDNCWIVVVPVGSVESTPTEWKIVLLNTAIKDNTFFTDMLKATDRKLWRWRDIDGRKLSFRNDNRPARRFLYMRYALAWLHADDKSWPDFKEKVPPGEVWASPNKPDGYLRKSILLELGEKTGDRLPKDFINAGIFEDPGTSSAIYDEVAGIRVVGHVQDHLDGVRDAQEDEEDTEGAGEEEELMEDE